MEKNCLSVSHVRVLEQVLKLDSPCVPLCIFHEQDCRNFDHSALLFKLRLGFRNLCRAWKPKKCYLKKRSRKKPCMDKVISVFTGSTAWNGSIFWVALAQIMDWKRASTQLSSNASTFLGTALQTLLLPKLFKIHFFFRAYSNFCRVV